MLLWAFAVEHACPLPCTEAVEALTNFDSDIEHQLRKQDNWKLALKTGKTTKFGYESALWTDSNLFNQNSPAITEEDAKYREFNTVPFKKIRMCVGSPESNCVEHVFSKTYSSARELFSSGYIADSEVRKDDLLKAFGPAEGSYKDCPMQKPGAKLIESRSCYKLNARLLRACLFRWACTA